MTQTTNVVAMKPQTTVAPVYYPVTRRKVCDDSTLNAIDPKLYELLDMLRIRRRHNTQTEIDFCKEFMQGITRDDGKFVKFNILKDPTNGDTIAYYYTASKDPVLWSSHVDSVHSGAGYVKVAYDTVMNSAFVEDLSTPLGADDAAGMWILFQMIRAGVGGTYIFHKGEEVGGIGSSAVAKHHAGFLSNFNFAIAFDRKSTGSVITYQGGKRCCSDAFADSFIEAMNAQGLNYSKDDTGVFTDTKNYINHIGECTNISCGYMYEHTQNETLDVEHLINLKNACIAAFKGGFTRLVHKRQKGENESKTYGNSKWTPRSYGQVKSSYLPPTTVKPMKDIRKASKEDQDIMDFYGLSQEELDELYNTSFDAGYTKPKAKVKKSNELPEIFDLAELETLYFDMHNFQSNPFADMEAEVMEHVDYIIYDEEITDIIAKMQESNRDDLKRLIEKTSFDTLTSVVKKLLFESGL